MSSRALALALRGGLALTAALALGLLASAVSRPCRPPPPPPTLEQLTASPAKWGLQTSVKRAWCPRPGQVAFVYAIRRVSRRGDFFFDFPWCETHRERGARSRRGSHPAGGRRVLSGEHSIQGGQW